MSQAYLFESDETDEHKLPDLEVFYAGDEGSEDFCTDPDDNALEAGWYWWVCYPGCLPDGDPCGPFESESEALADAREGLEDN